MTPKVTPTYPRGVSASCLLRYIGLLVLALLLVLPGRAAEAVRARFDLPAGAAEKTLKQFSEQASREVLFGSSVTKGVKTNPVSGEFTPREALEAMLADTGLMVVADEKTGSFSVRKETPVEAKNVNRAIAESSARPEKTGRIEQNENGESVVKLDTFEVMGSKLLNMDIPRSRDDAQPYVVYNRTTIERSGATNLDDFLKQRLTMNATRGSPGQGSNGGNASTINLRGLGASQTLILIDGHRTASLINNGAPVQPDINGIPLNAIERIEVLPTTASGIYGGGATGGVINIILRRDYVGAELKVTYDNSFDTDSAIRRVDFSAGYTFEQGRTTVLLAGSYSDANALLVQDRNFLARGRAALIANNGGNYQVLNTSVVPAFGATANVRSLNGSNLVLKTGTPLNSPITFAPVGYAGAASDGGAALVANAGRYNIAASDSALSGGGGRQGLTNTPEVSSVSLTVRRKFSSKLELFVDAFAANNEGRFRTGGPSITATNIPASAPTNPFTTAIAVRASGPGLDNETWMSWHTRRLVGGAIFSLPREWKGELDYNWSRTRFDSESSLSANAALGPALANGTVDALRDHRAFPIDWTPYIVSPFIDYLNPVKVTSHDVTLRLGGPVATLPGGPLTLSGLIEHQEEKFDQTVLLQPLSTGLFYALFPDRSQSFKSAYLEASLPIIGKDNPKSWAKEFSLQLGARYDEYTVNGVTSLLTAIGAPPTGAILRDTSRTESTSYTVALSYQPIPDVKLRASYGTGFLPPNVNQILKGALSTPSNFLTIDPRRGNTPTGLIQSYSGGNPQLRPESSKSLSAGVIITPSALPGLRLSIDYSRITKEDNISQLTPQQLLDNEALFPDRVTRGANLPGDLPGWAGPVTIIDRSLANFATTGVQAFDFQLDYDRNTSWGRVAFYALATRQTEFQTQFLPASPLVENVGLSGFPLEWKGNAGLSLTRKSWTAGWAVRYFDSYLIADPTVASNAAVITNQGNGGRIDGQTYHDLFLRWSDRQAGSAGKFRRLVANTEVTLGIRNVFDSEPPLDVQSAAAPAFYSTYGDARLRTYYISVKKRL